MPTTPRQIDVWRQSPSEHQRLEFKEAKNQLDNKKLYEYRVAIANEGGGELLLGIRDKPPREVVGTNACSNPVGMAEKLFSAVGFRVDIEEVQHPDGRVVVFHIPSRPRGTAYHFAGAYLMRSGEALVGMTEDQLRQNYQPPLSRYCDGSRPQTPPALDITDFGDALICVTRNSQTTEKSDGRGKENAAITVPKYIS
jgi:predicted HTH transcriptional regulator